MRVKNKDPSGRGKYREIQDMGPNERSPEAYEAKGRAVDININRNEARTPHRITAYQKPCWEKLGSGGDSTS